MLWFLPFAHNFFPLHIHTCGVVQSALNEFLFLDDTVPTSGILKQHLRSKHQQHRTSNSSVGGAGSQVSIEDVTDEDEYYHYGAGNSRRRLSEGSVNPYSKHHSPPPAYLVDLPEDQVEENSLSELIDSSVRHSFVCILTNNNNNNMSFLCFTTSFLGGL